MKFIHTGDLHIGKIVNGFSMLEEQKQVLEEIFELAEKEKVDAVLIAGDIYDRAVPPKEAVLLFDDFLGKCTQAGICVAGIAGNHDSPERLSFGQIPLKRQGIYLEGLLKEKLSQISFRDAYGTVKVCLLPYAGSAEMRACYGGGQNPSSSLNEGVKMALEQIKVQEGERYILVTHHFVGAGEILPETCDSETRVMVGGADMVDASLFDMFDYTALGHLHGAQKIGKGNVYYSGSPVKYSFSEAAQKKSVYLTEIKEKGNVTVKRHFLTPVHDMRIIRGPLMELIRPEVYSLSDREDYICVRLTDEEELMEPAEILRSVYPNLMQLILEKNLSGKEEQSFSGRSRERKSPEELFSEFFLEVTGREADEARLQVMREALAQAEKEEP